MIADQEQLFAEDADVAALRALLQGGHWLKRKHIMLTLGWTERRVPETAEKMGAQIVRSRTLGFKLTELLTPEEIPVATRAANAARAQGRKELGYYLALKRELVRLSARQIHH